MIFDGIFRAINNVKMNFFCKKAQNCFGNNNMERANYWTGKLEMLHRSTHDNENLQNTLLDCYKRGYSLNDPFYTIKYINLLVDMDRYEEATECIKDIFSRRTNILNKLNGRENREIKEDFYLSLEYCANYLLTTDNNINTAIEFYERLYNDTNSPSAAKKLGDIFYEGKGDIEVNKEEAVKYYERYLNALKKHGITYSEIENIYPKIINIYLDKDTQNLQKAKNFFYGALDANEIFFDKDVLALRLANKLNKNMLLKGNNNNAQRNEIINLYNMAANSFDQNISSMAQERLNEMISGDINLEYKNLDNAINNFPQETPLMKI